MCLQDCSQKSWSLLPGRYWRPQLWSDSEGGGGGEAGKGDADEKWFLDKHLQSGEITVNDARYLQKVICHKLFKI